jgi:hypothetical protein
MNENTDTAWYDDHRNLAAVARNMGAKGDDIGPIMDMLEKPWNWTEEWIEVRDSSQTTSV